MMNNIIVVYFLRKVRQQAQNWVNESFYLLLFFPGTVNKDCGGSMQLDIVSRNIVSGIERSGHLAYKCVIGFSLCGDKLLVNQ